jgi:hypothetical protein
MIRVMSVGRPVWCGVVPPAFQCFFIRSTDARYTTARLTLFPEGSGLSIHDNLDHEQTINYSKMASRRLRGPDRFT